MYDLVCAICACKNAKHLINIDTGQLRDLYDMACGFETRFFDALPSYICKLCVSYLIKFYGVQNHFRSGFEATLKLNSLIEQNPDNEYVIDRSGVTMHPVLSHSEPDKMKFIEMKHQPYSMFTLKPQNQTRIPSFHTDISNTDENYLVNETVCITEEQAESLYQFILDENSHTDAPTEKVNVPELSIPSKNTLMDVDDILSDTTLELVAKILPISQELRSIEKYMVVKLLSDNEMRAVNEVWATIRNRKLNDEEKECICDKCLFYIYGDMDSHKKEHEEESGTVCTICFTSFSEFRSVQFHYLNHHLFKFICRICNDVLFKFSDARNHLKGEHNKSFKELSQGKEVRDSAFANLETHFNLVPSTTQEAIEIMMKRYTNATENFIPCGICMKKIKNDQALLKKHEEKHVLLPGQVQCEVCKYTFCDKYKLRSHYDMFHYWKYSCKQCDYVTTMKNFASTHKLYHLRKGDISKYKCKHCYKDFKHATSLATHIRYVHPCNAVCNICGESFGNDKGLKQHKRLMHTEEERTLGHLSDLDRDTSSELYCKECDVQFIDQDGYDKHLQSSGKHNEEYRNNKRLKKLLRKEAKEKPRRTKTTKRPKAIQKCHVCGAELKGITTTTVHFRKFHPNDPYYLEHLRKEYRCDLCDFKTYNQSTVFTHKKNAHSSLRPFKCPHCDACFKTKGNMQRHILVHTGENLFECVNCQRRFKQKSACQLHIQTVHLKIPYLPWKNKRKREKRQIKSEKTTKKRKYSNEVEQEVVVEDAFYLEEQELATDYITKENLVYSTTSRENIGQRSYVLSINEP